MCSVTHFFTVVEQITSDAWLMFDGKYDTRKKDSIGSRSITNLRFADNLDALAEEKQELEALVESLDKTCTRYKMNQG